MKSPTVQMTVEIASRLSARPVMLSAAFALDKWHIRREVNLFEAHVRGDSQQLEVRKRSEDVNK